MGASCFSLRHWWMRRTFYTNAWWCAWFRLLVRWNSDGSRDEVLASDAERRSMFSQASPPHFQIGPTAYTRTSTCWIYCWFWSRFEGVQSEILGAVHYFYWWISLVSPSDLLPLHSGSSRPWFRDVSLMKPTEGYFHSAELVSVPDFFFVKAKHLVLHFFGSGFLLN